GVGAGAAHSGPRSYYPVETNPPERPPVADFRGSPTSGVAPLTVSFINLSQRATSYLWDFGDGSGSDLDQPSKTYSNAGVYSVTLTAVGAGGGSDIRTRANYIVVTKDLVVPCTNLPSPVLNLGTW